MLNLKNEIRDLIAQLGDLDVADIGDDTHLAGDLRLDSIQALDLLVELERKYNISIPEVEMDKFVSVNNLAGLVSDLLAATSRR
jgi:acyl carrier protein